MTDRQEWLSIQNGQPSSKRTQLDSPARYIHTGRDLAEYTAALILLGQGPAAIESNNPYLNAKTQVGGTTLALETFWMRLPG